MNRTRRGFHRSHIRFLNIVTTIHDWRSALDTVTRSHRDQTCTFLQFLHFNEPPWITPIHFSAAQGPTPDRIYINMNKQFCARSRTWKTSGMIDGAVWPSSFNQFNLWSPQKQKTENFGLPMVVLNRSTTSSHKNQNGNVEWDQGFGRKEWLCWWSHTNDNYKQVPVLFGTLFEKRRTVTKSSGLRCWRIIVWRH